MHCIKKLKNPGLPIYHLQLDSSKKQEQKHKHSHFVEVSCGDKAVYIHKTTAVWLLQETERVSTDRLFRVRNKQPFATQSNTSKIPTSSAVHPIVWSSISVSDMCVFKTTWKVLQFSNYFGKIKKCSAVSWLDCKCSKYKSGGTMQLVYHFRYHFTNIFIVTKGSYLCTYPYQHVFMHTTHKVFQEFGRCQHVCYIK